MKKLRFSYEMIIDYSDIVSWCNFTIKCIPKTTKRQWVNDIQIYLDPESRFYEGKDGLKNQQIYGSIRYPHKNFIYKIIGEIKTGLADYEEEEDIDLSMIFNHPHGLNVAGERIKEFSRMIKPGEGNNLDKAIIIMQSLYDNYSYVPNTTQIDTTAEEAFEQGCGVCQDYSHIFISLLHLFGIPARYVTGFIIGEGATHAWVEILMDGKWYGLDPTHNERVKDNHIKLSVGRDARDCEINRGIMGGGGLHTQTIKVNVGEI